MHTLEGLDVNTATEQDVFDFVARKLIAQGKPAFDAELRTCMYRTQDGLKCAAGQLIPDDEYSPSLEKKSVTTLSMHRNDLIAGTTLGVLLEKFPLLIAALQRAHDAPAALRDAVAWPEPWHYQMRAVAGWFGLDSAVLDGAA